jgi:hypothetical protein
MNMNWFETFVDAVHRYREREREKYSSDDVVKYIGKELGIESSLPQIGQKELNIIKEYSEHLTDGERREGAAQVVSSYWEWVHSR